MGSKFFLLTLASHTPLIRGTQLKMVGLVLLKLYPFTFTTLEHATSERFKLALTVLYAYIQDRKYSQTSIIRSVRDRQIFSELSVVRIFEIGTFRQCSVVFVGNNFRLYKH